MDFAIGWVDATMLGVLAFSLLIGVWRGFVFEVLAIGGWFVAFFTAQWAWPDLAPHLPVGSSGSLLNHAAAFALAFFLALIVWSLLSRMVRRVVRATPLAPVDRLFGAGFGLLRGLVVLLVLAAVVAYTPLAASADWRASAGAGWLNAVLQGVKPWLPPSAANLLRA